MWPNRKCQRIPMRRTSLHQILIGFGTSSIPLHLPPLLARSKRITWIAESRRDQVDTAGC